MRIRPLAAGKFLFSTGKPYPPDEVSAAARARSGPTLTGGSRETEAEIHPRRTGSQQLPEPFLGFLSVAGMTHLPPRNRSASGGLFIPLCSQSRTGLPRSDVSNAVPVLLDNLLVLLATSPAPSLAICPALLFSCSAFPLWVTLFTNFAYIISC